MVSYRNIAGPKSFTQGELVVSNPYRWQQDSPAHVVPRQELIDSVATELRRGKAVQLIGGRGMGKSVFLRLLGEHFEHDRTTSALRISSPPLTATIESYIQDIQFRLNMGQLAHPNFDCIFDALDKRGISQLILLIDEADQYVIQDDNGRLARRWFNHLESVRKSYTDRLSILVAGGLGLFHLSHVLGSGLISRAEKKVLHPFSLEDLRCLAQPFERAGRPLNDSSLQTLAVLSGGNPAIATYGLEKSWEASDEIDPTSLQHIYAVFMEKQRDFIQAIYKSITLDGKRAGPIKTLELIQKQSAPVSQKSIRETCAVDTDPLDTLQTLELLAAAGLVRVDGLATSEPVHVFPVQSILNIPSIQDSSQLDPIERLLSHIEAILAQLHRFGRDFHGEKDLLNEQVFSSLLAVALAVLGWSDVDREVVQLAGYPDLRVRLRHSGIQGNVVLETKIWARNDYKSIHQQVNEYRLSDTLICVAIMIGKDPDGITSSAKYAKECLPREQIALPCSSDLGGHWKIEQQDEAGALNRTDHFLVNLPKRR